MVCLRLSSPNQDACTEIFTIINKLFSTSKIILKFISFEEDFMPVIKFCNRENTKIYKGKNRLKFFTVAFPELHAEIATQEDLLGILSNWSSVIYQTIVLYVVNEENKEKVLQSIENDTYKGTDSIFSTWDNVKLAIRNQPEANCHNTFALFIHKEYLKSVLEFFDI